MHRLTFSQQLTGEQRILMASLLDSAEYYELSNPIKCLEFSTIILNTVPVEGNEVLYVQSLLNAANSEKMLSGKQQALDHCNRALGIAHQLRHPELIVRSYFMKGSIFGQDNDEDSTLVAYQKVIEYHEPEIQVYFITQAYANIGGVYADIGNPEKAEEYLILGLQAASGDEYARLFVLSEMINFYRAQKDPKYVRYLDTLAMTDFYKKASHASRMAHMDAFLKLDQDTPEENEIKLRELFAYSKINSHVVNRITYGLKLYEALEAQGKHDQGYALLLEILQLANDGKNGRQLGVVYNALSLHAKDHGNFKDALTFLERYSDIRDSMLSEENRATISELNVKFETAQKDLEITQQKAHVEDARRNRNFFIAMSALLGVLVLLTFFFFRNKTRATRKIAEQQKVIHVQETERLIQEKEVAELTASLQTQERERNRIARDLHDGLGSLMSGISAQVETLRAQPTIEAIGSPYLGQLKDMVKEATSELRRTSYELMPASLLRQGLEPAVRDLCMNLLFKNGIEPTLEINADLTTLTHEQQLTLYRIIQELLNNIVKHAGAKEVFIQFNHYDHEMSLVVEDDGKGFDVAEKTKNGGLGLGSLQSRVNLLKGFLDIASMPNEGTTVTVNFSL